jgi:hypothetical protein
MILSSTDLAKLRKYADDDALQQAAEIGARKSVLAKRIRSEALEEAARRFEQGDGKLLSQYEVARILRGMR